MAVHREHLLHEGVVLAVAEVGAVDLLVGEEGAMGRSQWDAPEIDGSVFVNGDTDLKPGDIVRATVAHADAYDLWA